MGKGFHTIQALIAIGSGGLSGKGWMEGTQAHLDFIPERTSDFLFAVYGEEFGFIGCSLLLVLFTCLVARSFYIASQAPSTFSRLLGGALFDLLYLLLRQHGHGERHSPRRGRSASLHELRRDGAPHSGRLDRDPALISAEVRANPNN